MESQSMCQCLECGRVFDLTNEQDAGDLHFGHDCEEE